MSVSLLSTQPNIKILIELSKAISLSERGAANNINEKLHEVSINGRILPIDQVSARTMLQKLGIDAASLMTVAGKERRPVDIEALKKVVLPKTTPVPEEPDPDEEFEDPDEEPNN